MYSMKSVCMPIFVLIGCCASAVYCYFTRTTLFTTMLTVIIVVCSLKGVCIPSFVLIDCCVSELQGHLCPYRNVWPEAVYCCFKELQCLPNCLHAFKSRVRG